MSSAPIVAPAAVRPPVPGFFARLTEMMATTDQFVTWWGEHRAWPANEPARIGRAR